MVQLRAGDRETVKRDTAYDKSIQTTFAVKNSWAQETEACV